MSVIVRYSDSTRIKHWAVVLLFLCAGLSGLALFHPAFYFFSLFFGGGPWTRILHPFFGVLMVFGFLFLFFKMWRDNIWRAADTAWMRDSAQLIKGREDAMPPVGKYNAGQKLVFWVFGLCLLLLLVTGFMFWQPWFAGFFPIVLRRIAVLVHAIAAVVLIIGVIIHVYAAIWVKGSVRAMTRGIVSDTWARRHHPLWHKEISSKKERTGA